MLQSHSTLGDFFFLSSSSEELCETETEDKFSYHGDTSPASENSTDGENEEFHTEYDGRSLSELPINDLDASIEVVGQEEISQKACRSHIPPLSSIDNNNPFASF